MATKSKTTGGSLFRAGDYTVKADGGFFAVLCDGEWEDGCDTLAEAKDYARMKNNGALLERLVEAASMLSDLSPSTEARLEAAIAAITRKPA